MDTPETATVYTVSAEAVLYELEPPPTGYTNFNDWGWGGVDGLGSMRYACERSRQHER